MMADIKKPNKAIEDLEDECKRHYNCDECPLFDDVEWCCLLKDDSVDLREI